MDSDGPTHQLAAIISGDIVGYSRLISSDEATAVRLVTAYREEVELLVRQHHGHLVDFTGDNFLAYFSSSLSAVRCAIEIQQVLKARNQSLPDDRRMEFRLGVHQGEVRVEDGRVFGTGVNIAARLEALAEPGGICISGSIKDQLQGRMELRTEDMGSKSVKNIPQPVPAHRLVFGGVAASKPATKTKATGPPRVVLAAVGIVVLTVALGVGSQFTRSEGEVGELEVAAEDLVATSGSAAAYRGTVGSSKRATARQDKPSIVVLPFVNMSGDAEQEYFADGISEDLTTDLSKVPQLFVIARNSAFTYKGRAVDVEQVGRELGVRYLLEGSVRKVQGRVRITAQLIDATTGFHVWSDRYDRDLSDIFAVQNEINGKILSAMKVNIAEAEFARIRRQPIENLSAYEAWHKGRMLVRQLAREPMAEGRRLLEYAIELQPGYGDAYAAVANSYMAEFAGWNLDPSLPKKAAEYAERSLELSPLSPLSYVSLASVEMGRLRPDRAIPSARRALELAPSSAAAYTQLGLAQMWMGLVDDGRANLEQAVRLNPMATDLTYSALGSAYYRTGEPEEAVKIWERVRAENVEALPDRLLLAQYYQAAGDTDRAKLIVKEILQVNPFYTADQAVDVYRLLNGMPDGMDSVIIGNFKLAGLP
ncbi:MAG: adenylate/guanylate cyclase domain-containing protein [Deltaproteobacteria bacterium]|nr:adenylate/guanylate cyclase domain-containing protein [Deltaproteobacteria bacterium]